jgi:glycosyltransferase involved in cell wall biosynthesis
MAHPIDIVIGTKNRLDMLRRTITCIRERTTTPYRLTVIDDASADGTADYLAKEGIRTVRHEQSVGMHGNLCEVAGLTVSDPVITSDDDCLCPKLDPDWLARLLEAMAARPEVMMLGLNDPTGNRVKARYPYADDGEVVYSKYVSGHYLAQRRKLLEVTPTLFKKSSSCVSPNKTQAHWVHEHGYKVGYLKHVYTWHFCPESQRRPNRSWADILVTPINMETLEPPEEYRQ